MRILIDIIDESLLAEVVREIQSVGHVIVSDEDASATADVIITDNLERTREPERAAEHLLAIIGPDEIGLLTGRESDFAIVPMQFGELNARLRVLDGRPGPRAALRSKLLSTAVAAAPDIIELTNSDAVLEYVNPAFTRILGYEYAEAIGKTPAMLVRSDMHDLEFFKNIDETLARGDIWSGVLISMTRDGLVVHLETTLSPVANEDGEVTHHVSVKRDITDRLEREKALHETNRALEQARDAALAASRAKSEFLANMSHELRTPLNAIIGYSEILMDDFKTDQGATRDLGRIRSSGTHLLDLINDVLDISKIEADKFDLYVETVELDEIVRSVTATIEPLAAERSNRYVVSSNCAGRVVQCDRVRLRQVLLNLLSNACKFTENGEVRFEIAEVQVDGVASIRFIVADDGIGISEQQQTSVFRPFVQADSSTTREYGGTGLGLAISQRLVEMMDGTISLESRVGEGSAFTVTLPLAHREATEAGAGLVDDYSVLVIDDDKTIHDLVARSLSKTGLKVAGVQTGEEGLRLAQRGPDLIILDVKLPGMSGWDVLSELKLSEKTSEIPVIMLTMLAENKVGHSLGAADYLIKPVVGDRLARVVRRHIKADKSTILIVEDDAPTRDVIRRTLEKSGYAVLEAEHGRAGLEMLEKAAPDLVILDLMMPVMDGIEFLDRLKTMERFADLPVIVATVRTLSPDEKRELEAVVMRVIEKNAYTRQQLLEQINLHVEKLVRTRPGSKSNRGSC